VIDRVCRQEVKEQQVRLVRLHDVRGRAGPHHVPPGDVFAFAEIGQLLASQRALLHQFTLDLASASLGQLPEFPINRARILDRDPVNLRRRHPGLMHRVVHRRHVDQLRLVPPRLHDWWQRGRLPHE
jgi:hypothetical protein